MLYLLEQVDFLKHLSFAEVILHVLLLNRLDRDILACQLVHAQRHLAKRTLPYQLDELIELQRRWWQLIVLCYVILDVTDKLFSFFEE